ncbi:MAG TPA: polysaccharide biosynthesis C-terminal domain-containing protein [Candidatus Dormibacteraeota bacterium]|jgi:O-antigen/teichoic acid export membrane protein
MILRKGLLTVVIQLFQLAAIVAITILVTRVTGAHGRGVYTLVYALANLAAMITALGISWAGIYYIGKRRFPLADVASTLLTVSMAAGAVAVAGLAAAYFIFRSTYFHDVSLTQAVIMLVLAAIIQLVTTTSSIVLGLNRPLHFAGLSLLQFGVALLLQGILALAGSLTATSALIALAVGAAGSAVVGLVLVGREVPLRLGFDSKILRSFLNFGIRGYIANLMQFMNYRLDALIVNGLLGIVSVGYYSIATAMAEALWYGANALALVLFPHVSSLERKEADRITPVVCRNAVFMTLVGAVLMFAVSRQLILAVFGSGMTPALHPLWLLLPGIVTLTAAKVISSYLSGIGKPTYSTYVGAGTVVLTVILDLVLIPRFGINGAAVASSIVYTLTAATYVWILRRESGARLLETLVVRPSDFVRYRRVLDSTVRRLIALSPARS